VLASHGCHGGFDEFLDARRTVTSSELILESARGAGGMLCDRIFAIFDRKDSNLRHGNWLYVAVVRVAHSATRRWDSDLHDESVPSPGAYTRWFALANSGRGARATSRRAIVENSVANKTWGGGMRTANGTVSSTRQRQGKRWHL